VLPTAVDLRLLGASEIPFQQTVLRLLRFAALPFEVMTASPGNPAPTSFSSLWLGIAFLNFLRFSLDARA